MKTTTLVLILFLTGLDLWAQMPPTVRTLPTRPRIGTNTPPGVASPLPSLPNVSGAVAPSGTPFPTSALQTRSAEPSVLPNNNNEAQREVPGYTFNYEGVDVNQVLDVYANLVGRTLIRGSVPQASIILKTQSPLTKTEAIEALQAVLAVNNIAVIPIGDKFAKVVPTDQAGGAGGELNYVEANNLPDMGSYVTHIVQLKYIKPSAMVPFISPLAKINSIIPIDDNGILIIRDYAENVKRMLEMISQIDVNTPLEYTNEVIPIKYALADDIANALNSLGGQGSATVTFGSSSAPSTINGVSSPRSGVSGTSSSSSSFGPGGSTANQSYNNQPRTTYGAQGTSTPNGTPTGGTTFQQRLQMALQNAARPTGTPGQEEPIQVFGEAKIIADERANSLLVFATRGDMERIKAVVAKLDVLLSQVLVESIIMDVSLNKGWSFGVSASQNPIKVGPNSQTAGGVSNPGGPPFLQFLENMGTNVFPGNFTQTLPTGNGLSYFGDLGPNWDVAVQAIASDNSINVIQRPQVQTSQAKPAQFFVGNTVPYITGTSYGTGYNGANSSTYSQLSVGVELDVTPFINPDGLVVMDINQEIDDINGFTPIDGNNVPNTDKRTLSSEVAVKDKDTIMLGGFIRSERDKNKSGIPLLMDIPILGNLFTSRSDAHDRTELVVLMRPTVLRTPEAAAEQTAIEEQRLPGVSAASEQNDEDESKQIAAERKEERRREHIREENSGYFTPAVPTPPPATVDTNLVVPLP